MSDEDNFFSAFDHLGRLSPGHESCSSNCGSNSSPTADNIFAAFMDLESLSPEHGINSSSQSSLLASVYDVGFENVPTLSHLMSIDPGLGEAFADETSEGDPDEGDPDDSEDDDSTLSPVIALPCSPALKEEREKAQEEKEKAGIERAAKRTDLSMKLCVEKQPLSIIQVINAH
jgi:hypothetical protein